MKTEYHIKGSYMKVYKRYENVSFDNFKCQANIDVLKKPRDLKNNVVLIGDVGTGKTHLAFSILNQECKKIKIGSEYYYMSDFVEYTTIKDMVDNICSCWKSNDYYDFKIVERYKTIPLLIVDEIGVQYGTDKERVELFRIFDDRYNDMLPVIAISNLNEEKITAILGKRIADRILGGAHIIKLSGKSMRCS